MANGQGLIKARRRLADLYKTGVECRFGGRYGLEGAIAPGAEGEFKKTELVDGKLLITDELDPAQDDEIALWVQPPSPLQRDMALRDANAARARSVLAIKRDEKSEEHLIALEFVESMEDETLFDYVLIGTADTRQQDAIREVLAEDEWKDLTELQDSLRVFEEEGYDDDHPEVVLVRERETELSRQVAAREKELREAEHSVMGLKGRASVIKQAMERRSDLVASRSFMVEYERQMTFYSIRDIDDHGVLFFGSAREMSESADELLLLVQKALDPFIKDAGDAKNSPRAESGSESSDLPTAPETSAPSTPEESIA